MIPTLGHPDDFTFLFYVEKINGRKIYFGRDEIYCDILMCFDQNLLTHTVFYLKLLVRDRNKKVKSSGWPKVGISQSARESIPFSLALDQGDCFFVRGGMSHLLSAPYFTAQIPVLLIR